MIWQSFKGKWELLVKRLSNKTKQEQQETYPADCRKIAAVDSHNSIERKENINKNFDCEDIS